MYYFIFEKKKIFIINYSIFFVAKTLWLIIIKFKVGAVFTFIHIILNFINYYSTLIKKYLQNILNYLKLIVLIFIIWLNDCTNGLFIAFNRH